MSKPGITPDRLIRLTAWALCLTPFVVAFDRMGSSAERLAGEGRPMERVRESERADERRTTPADESPAEWEQVKEFLRKHAPHRNALLERRAGKEQRPARFFLKRWRAVEALKTESPELYNTKVREVELEDDLLGICLRLNNGGDRPALQTQMKTKIADLFDLGVKERTLRIARVESALSEQKKTLNSEIQNRDALIAERFELIKSEGVEGASFNLKRALKAGRRSSTSPSSSESSPQN